MVVRLKIPVLSAVPAKSAADITGALNSDPDTDPEPALTTSAARLGSL